MFLAPRSVALALGLAALSLLWPFGPVSAVLVSVAVLGTVALADYWSASRPATFRPELDAPDSAVVGGRVPFTLRLHNPTERRQRVRVHLRAPPSLGRSPDRMEVRLGAAEQNEVEGWLSPGARGDRTLGPATVRTLGRLGIAGRQEELPVERRIRVYPDLPGRRRMAARLERAQLLRGGVRAAVAAGEGTTFDALRQYHPDDEFRRINWRATARASEPVTNTFKEESSQRVVILVDAGRTMATSIGGFTRYEHAMDSCVALAELAVHLGDHVGMMALAAEPLATVAPGTGKRHVRLILDRLFELEPSLAASNYGRAFGALLGRFARRALLILLTELTEPAAMRGLLDALPALVRRHLVIVASLTDPAIRELTASRPGSSSAAYAKAAAEGFVSGRQAAASALRSLGAVVLDEDPDALPGRLADEYLRIKAFGRL